MVASNKPPNQSNQHFLLWREWLLLSHLDPIGSLLEARLFGGAEKDEECDHDHMVINDFNAQGGDKGNYSIAENNSNTCKGVVHKHIL